ncbi:MAG TPA: hypothetical protein VJ600_05730 [Holophagaceae bacterium]|nr:hypothetical protein [Holophagaceae bacterium]
MLPRHMFLALVLPLPPWLGFQVFKRKGRVGLSYGYFLGGILCALMLPWPTLLGRSTPTAHMGGALLGFTLFLQATREGAQGLRRLGLGLGGASLFLLAVLSTWGLPLSSLILMWILALGEGLLWLILSDLGYRITRGRWLQLRMPLVGAAAMGISSITLWLLPEQQPRLHPLASAFAGLLLGLVALEQLLWLRAKGTWVEGRGEGLRAAFSMLDRTEPSAQGLGISLDARQPLMLVSEQGRFLEANSPLSRLVGMPRHQIRGYALDALFQGLDRPVWTELKEQLFRHGSGHASANLVSKDGNFREVRVEAVIFDHNLALAWVEDPEPGGLAVRGEAGTSVLSDMGLDAEGGQRLVNCLGTILPAAEQILSETQEDATRRAAHLILQAGQRLRALAGAAEPSVESLDAAEAVEAILPMLRRMLPETCDLQHRTPSVLMRVPKEALQRIATHLVLHARQALRRGTVTLSMERRILGGRHWACWRVEAAGDYQEPQELLGLAWLQQLVRQSHGMLECARNAKGGLWPAVYLPLEGPMAVLPPVPLLEKRIWILDRDPLVRETLVSLIRQQGGEAEAFDSLREMLRRSRQGPEPSVLVLERDPRLDRFQRALRKLQRSAIPTLVMGNGKALPLDPAAFGMRQVGFLDKPFPSQDFLQSLLALSEPSPAMEPPPA